MKKVIITLFIYLLFSTVVYAEDKLNNKKINQILLEQQEILKKQKILLDGVDVETYKTKTVTQKKVLTTTDEKINQIIINQEKLDKLLRNQKNIYEKVENNPFKEKEYGVEINLIRLLMIGSDYKVFTGTVSMFYPKDKIEIAFPIFISSEKDWNDEIQRTITLDIQYRKFLGDTMNGFYLSGFIRGAYLKGTIYNTNWDYDAVNTQEYGSEKKLGLGFGIGYRIFSKSGFYWGTSLIIGKYIIGENDKFEYGGLDDLEYIVDLELLKFGYGF